MIALHYSNQTAFDELFHPGALLLYYEGLQPPLRVLSVILSPIEYTHHGPPPPGPPVFSRRQITFPEANL